MLILSCGKLVLVSRTFTLPSVHWFCSSWPKALGFVHRKQRWCDSNKWIWLQKFDHNWTCGQGNWVSTLVPRPGTEPEFLHHSQSCTINECSFIFRLVYHQLAFHGQQQILKHDHIICDVTKMSCDCTVRLREQARRNASQCITIRISPDLFKGTTITVTAQLNN